MYTHVVLGSNELEKSKKFYDAVFGAIGHDRGHYVGNAVAYTHEGGLFVVTKPIDGELATHANGGTIGFSADSPELVDAWHAAGVANGGASCEGPPGVRDMGFTELYLAYLRDPDGNKLCAMFPLGIFPMNFSSSDAD